MFWNWRCWALGTALWMGFFTFDAALCIIAAAIWVHAAIHRSCRRLVRNNSTERQQSWSHEEENGLR